MNPFTFKARKPVLCAALGAAMVLAIPATAEAITTAHTTASIVTPASTGNYRYYTGDNYPETPAGLAACEAEGTYLQKTLDEDVASYSCPPNAGRYDLWLLIINS